ncbi:unnamed protein product [Lymnaea stagnalis]|uniref:Uncharacterized protein n=1 Tax=Lymnaea stagnalis TaxID=6523 RepID=A0AAV2HTR2_LYMST
MVMQIMDHVKIEVKEALPYLSDECLEKLLDQLTTLGVEDKEDLKLVTEDDLIGVLTPIQCRKLLAKWTSPAHLAPKTIHQNSNCEHGDDKEVSLRPNPGRFRDSKRRHGSYGTDSHCSYETDSYCSYGTESHCSYETDTTAPTRRTATAPHPHPSSMGKTRPPTPSSSTS